MNSAPAPVPFTAILLDPTNQLSRLFLVSSRETVGSCLLRVVSGHGASGVDAFLSRHALAEGRLKGC